jgi:nickel transport protein
MRPRVALLALALVMVAGGPAWAHRLKLFAAVAGNEVSGYGFFVGGGRPAGVPIVARDASGAEIWRGTTGDDGAFAFTVTKPEALTLSLDAGDGHAVEETLSADRFGAAPEPPVSTAPKQAAMPNPRPGAEATAPISAEAKARLLARVSAVVAAEVDKAVARQIRPLLEAQAAAEARIRLNDILGGLGWIAGLVGVGLYFSRRSKT